MRLTPKKPTNIIAIALLAVSLLGLSCLALINPAEAAYGLNPALRQVKTADKPAVY